MMNPDEEIEETLEESDQWRLRLLKYKFGNKWDQEIRLEHLCSDTHYRWEIPRYLDLGCSTHGPPPQHLYDKYLLLRGDYEMHCENGRHVGGPSINIWTPAAHEKARRDNSLGGIVDEFGPIANVSWTTYPPILTKGTSMEENLTSEEDIPKWMRKEYRRLFSKRPFKNLASKKGILVK